MGWRDWTISACPVRLNDLGRCLSVSHNWEPVSGQKGVKSETLNSRTKGVLSWLLCSGTTMVGDTLPGIYVAHGSLILYQTQLHHGTKLWTLNLLWVLLEDQLRIFQVRVKRHGTVQPNKYNSMPTKATFSPMWVLENSLLKIFLRTPPPLWQGIATYPISWQQ